MLKIHHVEDMSNMFKKARNVQFELVVKVACT